MVAVDVVQAHAIQRVTCTFRYLKVSCMLAKPMYAKELLSRYAAGQRDFRNLNLIAANLRNLNLSGADLRGTNLAKANLSNTNLSHANLADTVLIGANLVKTNLTQANLTNVDLGEVDLSAAILRNAIFS